MAGKGSPIEYLARWVEWNTKKHAQQHKAYIKDTKALLQHIEQLNITKAPFSESSILVSWDIKKFLPQLPDRFMYRSSRKGIRQ